jgi:uncharacterized protein (DUF58 family)
LVLIFFVDFEVTSVWATALALGMLWLLRREQDRVGVPLSNDATPGALEAATHKEASWK